MPRLDGWKVSKALRERETTRDIPVVILTSHSLDDSEREALQRDVFRILQKQDLSRATLAPAVLAAAASRPGLEQPPPPARLPL
jgi:CheY-like chemotaxis protein